MLSIVFYLKVDGANRRDLSRSVIAGCRESPGGCGATDHFSAVVLPGSAQVTFIPVDVGTAHCTKSPVPAPEEAIA